MKSNLQNLKNTPNAELKLLILPLAVYQTLKHCPAW